jgi:hypothetical protein
MHYNQELTIGRTRAEWKPALPGPILLKFVEAREKKPDVAKAADPVVFYPGVRVGHQTIEMMPCKSQ